MTDIIKSLNFQFVGEGAIDCLYAADTDDNGELDISDAIRNLNFQFLDGPAPENPFPQCGPDVNDDGFPPCEYPAERCE